MRRGYIGALAAFALVLAGAAGALLWWSERRSAEFAAAVPALEPPRPLPPIEVPPSLVVVPVEISLAGLRDVLDARVPTSGTERQPGGGSGLLRDLTVSVAWRRGPLDVATVGDALAIRAPVAGTLSAEARALLGPVAGEGALAGLVGLRARPRLTETWRFDPVLHGFEIETDDATLSLGPVTVPVRAWGTRALRAAVERALPRVNEVVMASPVLEQAARRAWDQLCRSTRVEARGDPPLPPVWIEVRPTGAVAAQPQIGRDGMRLVLGLEAAVRVMSEETRPACAFPERLRLIAPPERGPLRVAAPVDLSFATVNEALRTTMAGQRFDDTARGLVADLRAVSLRPAGDRLLVTAGVAVRHAGTGLAATGTVHALVRPVLDAAERRLRFADVRLDVASGDVLGRMAGAAAGPFLETIVETGVSVDLAREMARAERIAQAAVAAFNARGDGLSLDLALDGITLDGLAFDAERLRVLTTTTGTVRAAVERLSLR